MRIDIVQKGSKYTFYRHDIEEPIFNGRYKSSFFKDEYAEVYNSAGALVAVVKYGKSSWFPGYFGNPKATYIIDFPERSTAVEITVQSLAKGYWTFEYKGQKYNFYRHGGHKRSLFKEDRQVARYDKRTVNFFENDSAFVIANNDEDELLLLCLFLAYDMGEYNDAEISVDLGHIAEGVKKIDHDWRPWK